jgi:hypothetical protein
VRDQLEMSSLNSAEDLDESPAVLGGRVLPRNALSIENRAIESMLQQASVVTIVCGERLR